MKTDKFFKDIPFHRNGNYQGISPVLHVRVTCDCCSNSFQYEGAESQAADKAKECGWTKGATGIVRCRECTRRTDYILSHALEARS